MITGCCYTAPAFAPSDRYPARSHDVYLNVLGGIEIDEPAADLGIALAIATCFRDVVVDPDCVIIGEISLSGEIRNVCNLEKRIYEAQKLGFKKAIIPKLSKKLPDNFEIEMCIFRCVKYKMDS